MKENHHTIVSEKQLYHLQWSPSPQSSSPSSRYRHLVIRKQRKTNREATKTEPTTTRGVKSSYLTILRCRNWSSDALAKPKDGSSSPPPTPLSLAALYSSLLSCPFSLCRLGIRVTDFFGDGGWRSIGDNDVVVVVVVVQKLHDTTVEQKLR